ncbi:MAG: acyltransferase [Muribaculaceae bacterium]|nr:acyltransferase [Muribaculaceae bacterium]
MKSKFLLLYSWLIRSAMFFFPDIPQISRIRGYLYGLGMKRCGKNLIVQHDAILRNLENMEFGNDIRISNHVTLWGSGSLIIDDYVIIGPHTTIVTGNHSLGNGSFRNGTGVHGTIHLKSGCWVTANCTVCFGAVLPERSVLGANSMMNKAFDEPESIYGGVPAKFIKKIKQDA